MKNCLHSYDSWNLGQLIGFYIRFTLKFTSPLPRINRSAGQTLLQSTTFHVTFVWVIIVKMYTTVVAHKYFTVAHNVSAAREAPKIRVTSASTCWNWHRKEAAVLVGGANGSMRRENFLVRYKRRCSGPCIEWRLGRRSGQRRWGKSEYFVLPTLLKTGGLLRWPQLCPGGG